MPSFSVCFTRACCNTHRFLIALIALSTLALSGCRVESTPYNNRGQHPPSPPEPVALYGFGVIDTYGVDTGFSSISPPYISPYKNLGFFDIYWDIHANEAYITEIRINNQPNTNGSQLLASDSCEPFAYCDDIQTLSCEYTSTFDTYCETPSGYSDHANIEQWITQLPERLYLIVQVCDRVFIYCEYDARAVWFE